MDYLRNIFLGGNVVSNLTTPDIDKLITDEKLLRIEISGSSERLLQEEEISFDDTRLFHDIPMYKKIVRYFIGLMTRSIANNNHGNIPSTFEKIKGSFPKHTEISQDYQSCRGNKKIKFPIEEDVEFTYIGSFDCYIFHCRRDRKMHVYRYNRTLFICADGGRRMLPMYDFHNTFGYGDDFNNNKKEIMNFDVFFKLLHSIQYSIIDCNQILWFGHSGGMALSILSTFLLCCIKNSDFKTKNERFFDQQTHSFFNRMETELPFVCKSLRENISLFVCGTGGFPVLFETTNEFKNFYDELKGRYIHIVDGIRVDNIIYTDDFTYPLLTLLNLKYGIYYTTINIKELENNERPKYSGNQCLIGVNIGQELNIPLPWKTIKYDTCVPVLQNQITGQYIKFQEVPPPVQKIEDVSLMTSINAGDKVVQNLHDFRTYRDIISIYFFS